MIDLSTLSSMLEEARSGDDPGLTESLQQAYNSAQDAHDERERELWAQRDATRPLDEEWNPEPEREAALRRRPKAKRRLEKDVVADGIALLRQRGYARKVHGGQFGNTGEPDVDACVNGRACKFEAKTGTNKPTPTQVGAMRRWAAAGALVGWFRDNIHLLQLLEHLDDTTFVPDLTQPGCSCPLHQAGVV